MNVKIVVHEAEEGGYWAVLGARDAGDREVPEDWSGAVSCAEVPALPGCVSQGETMDELLANIREAIQARLDTEPVDGASQAEPRQVVELTL